MRSFIATAEFCSRGGCVAGADEEDDGGEEHGDEGGAEADAEVGVIADCADDAGTEMASPRAWMMKSWPAMAVARISGRTALRVAALTGPVPRKMKKMARARPVEGEVPCGPKKQTRARVGRRGQR